MTRAHQSNCHTARGGLWCTCTSQLYAQYDPLEVREWLRPDRRVRELEQRVAELENTLERNSAHTHAKEP